MSVIVKGMEMPNIPAFREKDNKVAFPAAVVLEKGKAPRLVVNYKIGYVDTNLKAYELVEVPTPHGRLIDVQGISDLENKHCQPCIMRQTSVICSTCILCDFLEELAELPTIIEAEVSE